MDIDVGAWGESGQGLALGVGQGELAHPLRQRLKGLDPEGVERRAGAALPLLNLFITHAMSIGSTLPSHKLEFSFA